VQAQYWPVRAGVCELSFGGNKGVSCAAVRCGVHVLSTHRDMVADSIGAGLYLNRDAGILSGGVRAVPQRAPAPSPGCALSASLSRAS
jgi:hypothetical protein